MHFKYTTLAVPNYRWEDPSKKMSAEYVGLSGEHDRMFGTTLMIRVLKMGADNKVKRARMF